MLVRVSVRFAHHLIKVVELRQNLRGEIARLRRQVDEWTSEFDALRDCAQALGLVGEPSSGRSRNRMARRSTSPFRDRPAASRKRCLRGRERDAFDLAEVSWTGNWS